MTSGLLASGPPASPPHEPAPSLTDLQYHPTSVLKPLFRRWRTTLGVYHAPDRRAGEVRARHLHTVMRLTPALMASNLANALLVVWALWGQVQTLEVLGWLLAVGVFCTLNLHVWQRWRAQRPRQVHPRTLWRAAGGAALLGLLWGFATWRWFPEVQANQRLLLATLGTGMMCGGAFVMAALPHAALAYITVLAAANLLALQGLPGLQALQGLLLVYAAVLCGGVLVTAQALTRRLQSEHEAARQGQLVGLLLRDFEQHAADMLWEVDAEGRFTHLAPRMAQCLGLDSDTAQAGSATLLDTLARHLPPDSSGTPCLSVLRAALAQGRAFSKVNVPVHTDQGTRWWAITAKPLRDHDGSDIGWRGVVSDVTDARESHRQLARLAHFDSLTGLANRVKMREHLTEVLAQAGTAPHPRAALMCLDVDHFKSINDTLGHAAGDAVLTAVARRLRDCTRTGDLAARLGGDEFALVVADASEPADLLALSRRVVASLGRPVQVGNRLVPIGVSVGVALAPEHGRTLDELLAHADLALYAAKEAGRGRHALFVPQLGDRRRRRVAVEQGLRQALAQGELHLHWQPRVALQAWQVVGAEALLRWQHPTLGRVSPAEFIPVAEQTGLIAEIGAWALAQACQQGMGLPAEVAVSVNVSAAQLSREDFMPMVHKALAGSGLAPQRLEIEVTESLLIDPGSAALRHLHALRSIGVKVALDDFGTGYSSLAYLRRFPFDTLKIDRAFVQELIDRADARAIVKTIVALARTLGMTALAEGVETPEQLALLRAAGCQAIQGYLVARPMPMAQLQALLARWGEHTTPGADQALPAELAAG